MRALHYLQNIVCAIALLLVSHNSMADTETSTVTIGAGTYSSSTVPFYNNTYYSTTQTIYTQSQLGKAGTISAIAFKVYNASRQYVYNMKIYMGHKSSSTFSSTDDYLPYSSMTQVYQLSGYYINTPSGWVTYTLQVPFEYNGKDNLVVVVCKDAQSTNTSASYYCSSYSGRCLYRGGNSSSYCDASYRYYGYSESAYYPNAQFTFSNETAFVDGIRYSLSSDGTAKLVDGTAATGTNITLPEYITSNNTNYTITSIENNAFKNNKTLTALYLPSTITYIGSNAFYNCTALKDISIPESVTSIGTSAFYGDSLALVRITDAQKWSQIDFKDMSANPVSSGAELIVNGYYLTSLELSYGTTTVSPYAFYGCKRLQNVYLPSTISTIGGYAFYGCSALTTVSGLSSTKITSVNGGTFRGCSSLGNITLPSIVSSISDRAFEGCESMTSFTIPDSLKTFGTSSFEGCTALQAYYVATGNKNFIASDGVLYDNTMTQIKAIPAGKSGSLVIPEGITTIGTLSGNSGITDIYIPSTVNSVSIYSFRNFQALQRFHVDAANKKFFDSDGMLVSVNSSNAIYKYIEVCPPGKTSCYISKDIYGSSTCAFTYAKKLKTLEFEPTPSAFHGSNSVSLSYSNESTDKGTFYYCPLETVKLNRPTSYTCHNKYGYYACSLFDKIETLKNVEIGDSLTSINYYLFYGCTGLESITLPKQIKNIGRYAFANCSNLNNIQILADTLTAVGLFAFSGTPFLKNHDAVRGVKYHNTTVLGCTDTAENISIREGTTLLADGAFYGKTNIENVTLPTSLKSIAYYAFYGCSNMSNINLSDSLKVIDEYALYGSGLKKIVIPAGVTDIRQYNFYNLSKLDTVIIKDSSKPLNMSYSSSWSTYYYGPFHESGVKYLYLGRDVSSSQYGFFNTNSSYYNNRTLNTVVIGDSVTYVSNYSFTKCNALEKVTLGRNVTSIGSNAFTGCSNLKDVACLSEIPATGLNVFSTPINALLTIPYKGCSAYKQSTLWSDFSSMTWKEDVLNLDESNMPSVYDVSIAGHCNTLNYIRNFRNTNWQPLYVPFDIDAEKTADNFEVAEFRDIHQYDNDNDGVADRTIIEASRLTSGTLLHNTPYLIRSKSIGKQTISLSDVTHYATDTDSLECSTMTANFKFKGTYKTMHSDELNSHNALIMSSGSFARPLAGSSLMPFRWYLSRDDNSVSASKISIGIDGGNAPTDIDIIDSVDEKDDIYYNPLGQRVDIRYHKGVVINKGKKHVNK